MNRLIHRDSCESCEGIDAPCVFDGPVNGESFKAYVEQVLAPVLRPGDIVVTCISFYSI